jgi:predicted RND superfamily exporter protein
MTADGPLSKAMGVVTSHNLIVILFMLVVSGAVVSGVTDLQLQSQLNGSDAVGDTEVAQKMEYIQTNYANDSEDDNATRPAVVYVRDEGDDTLTKDGLLTSLRYQQEVRQNDSVAAALGDEGRVTGVANVVARQAADTQDPSLSEQIAALEATDERQVDTLLERTLRPDSELLALLPASYDPGTASAESHRMVFQFADGVDEETRTAATKALYDAAAEQDDPTVFTDGRHAGGDVAQQQQQNMMTLILPAALLMILVVLAFSYRDVVDVVIGFAGVLLSVLWMFGILGWLQVPAGMTLIIGPVLIIGLSVDFGLHVFTRYREQRGDDEGVREPMHRGLSSVALALGLATLTTGVGFLSNATNEFATIRDLSIGITLGVVSAFIIFVTIVPALKVTVDRLLERIGLDRRKAPLGKTRLVEPFLASGATLARRAAPAVIVVALVAGAAGGYAWTDLDRQSVQQGGEDVAEWKQNLPGPLAWEISDAEQRGDYVDEQYRAASESDRRSSRILLEGDVTGPAALESVAEATDRAAETDAIYQQGDEVPVRSPLTVMQSVAAQDETFAATLADADTDGDGVPDRNVEGVYDALYDAAPGQASQVIERTDGEYRSLLVVVPIEQGATLNGQATAMQEAATAAQSDSISAIAVGAGTLNEAELGQTADSILTTLLLALGAVFLMLVVTYRLAEGSATLGAVTVVPIAVVMALVVGGMWIADVPLTLLTALLVSLVIGLSVDYNIHVSDRFAQELNAGKSVHTALSEAVTGTGGALLGSTLTSAGAFSALMLHPHPQFQSFGLLVVLAMTLSFVVSVFVLPSLLLVWSRYVHETEVTADTPSGSPATQD